MPPSAAPEWLRTGWIFEISATSAPASNASMAARIPAKPAPTMRTSCVASTAFGRYTKQPPLRLATNGAKAGEDSTRCGIDPRYGLLRLRVPPVCYHPDRAGPDRDSAWARRTWRAARTPSRAGAHGDIGADQAGAGIDLEDLVVSRRIR